MYTLLLRAIQNNVYFFQHGGNVASIIHATSKERKRPFVYDNRPHHILGTTKTLMIAFMRKDFGNRRYNRITNNRLQPITYRTKYFRFKFRDQALLKAKTKKLNPTNR